jgi:hypothetical protein
LVPGIIGSIWIGAVGSRSTGCIPIGPVLSDFFGLPGMMVNAQWSFSFEVCVCLPRSAARAEPAVRVTDRDALADAANSIVHWIAARPNAALQTDVQKAHWQKCLHVGVEAACRAPNRYESIVPTK